MTRSGVRSSLAPPPPNPMEQGRSSTGPFSWSRRGRRGFSGRQAVAGYPRRMSPTSPPPSRSGRALLPGPALGARAACSARAPAPADPPPASPPAAPEPVAPPRIGLALGGGAAKGFAHIGVIKMLEAHGIRADRVAGTSAGSVVGALSAAGREPLPPP